MDIYLLRSTGEGKTELSSFDDALHAINIADYNLIALSSVIPSRSKIIHTDRYIRQGNVGDRLYVVLSRKSSSLKGTTIGAALGWYQFDDGSGIFVEHESTSNTIASLKQNLGKQVYDSVTDLCKRRRKLFEEKKLGMEMAIAKVKNDPTTVLVMATYFTHGWSEYER